jgi:hypothetical protein
MHAQPITDVEVEVSTYPHIRPDSQRLSVTIWRWDDKKRGKSYHHAYSCDEPVGPEFAKLYQRGLRMQAALIKRTHEKAAA